MISRVLTRNSNNLRDIISNYEPIPSEMSRITKILSNSVLALLNPSSGEYLSTFGECSSYRVLQEIQQKMKSHPIGSQILQEKPRMRSFCINFDALGRLPASTLGKHYWDYMIRNSFHPDERPVVKHIGDIELAYIYQRYKEIHDFLHVTIGKGSTVFEEIEVKWFEFQQLGLTSTGLSSLIGPLRLNLSGKIEMFTHAGIEMIKLADQSQYCMNVYYEKHLEQDISEFRKFFFNKEEISSS